MDNIDRQKLETLDGSRNTTGGKGRSAVRRNDLAALLALPALVASKATTVTADQVNALIGDVAAIRKALDQIAGKVKP
jgi:hypothetical protein